MDVWVSVRRSRRKRRKETEEEDKEGGSCLCVFRALGCVFVSLSLSVPDNDRVDYST